MSYSMPRIVITGLSGGSGKTMISTGLARALSRKGYKVQTFKKGPDYIDTLWLSLASGYPPRNLDPYMIEPGLLPHLFENACKSNLISPDIAIIEGNRGLFDGQNLSGSASTAELARQLVAPIVLTMNCTKMTRTAAAIVLGMKNFEPDLNLAGVILNRVNRSRHRSIVKQAVEELAKLPVLGLVPSRSENLLEERSSGLYGNEAALASAKAFEHIDLIADFIEEHVDIDAIVRLAQSAPPLKVCVRPKGWVIPPVHSAFTQAAATPPDSASLSFSHFAATQAAATHSASTQPAATPPVHKPRLGYVRDAAFWCYYTENLEALAAAGAALIPLSLLDAKTWPELDGLYLGGGFPDDFASQLANNNNKKNEVAALICSGLPTYAEGPGFYYLTRSFSLQGVAYPMAGIFDFDLKLGKVARGIGYVQAVVNKPNPFHPVGSIINAHEFHYTDIGLPGALAGSSLMQLNRGTGMFYTKGESGRDGLLAHNCFISHMQVFAPGVTHWAHAFVSAAAKYALNRKDEKIIAE